MHQRFTRKEEKKQNETRVELKYCEHCGGLWLRESESGEIYCPTCRPRVARLPEPSRIRTGSTLLIGDDDVHGEDYDFDDLVLRINDEDCFDDDEQNVDSDDEDDDDDRLRAAGGAA